MSPTDPTTEGKVGPDGSVRYDATESVRQYARQAQQKDPTLAAILAEMDRSATRGPWSVMLTAQAWNDEKDEPGAAFIPETLTMAGSDGDFANASDMKVAVTLRNALPALATYAEVADRLRKGQPPRERIGTFDLEHDYDAAKAALLAALAGTPKEEGNG